MRLRHLTAALAAVVLLAVTPVIASAHPHFMPMSKGKPAISAFAHRTATAGAFRFAGLSECGWMRPGVITCLATFGVGGYTCTAPIGAAYAGSSDRVVAFGDKRQIHCR